MTEPGAYGDAFAEVYDKWYPDVTDAPATARFVAARCGSGPVLEIGVGTGRLARPLLANGLNVVGIDASAAMLSRCHAPGAHLLQADMTRLPLRGPFGAALIAFNTLFNVVTAEGQQAVFDEVSRVLAPDGVLIVETLDAAAFAGGAGTSIGVRSQHADGVTLVATDVRPAGQTIVGRHIELDHTGVKLRPWTLRWADAAEIDGYALAAGLEPAERFNHWAPPAGPGPTDHSRNNNNNNYGDGDGDGDVNISVYRPKSNRPLNVASEESASSIR